MQCTFTLLEHEALLHISGPDALTFLQGQATCDTRDAGPEQAVRGAYCTPQGRVVCDFLLLQLGYEHYALRMRRDIREQAREVFARYIVFSKATLRAGPDDWLIAGVVGSDARGLLEKIFGRVPRSPLAGCSGKDFVLVQTDAAGEMFECFLAADSTWPQALADASEAGSEACWRFRELSEGIARIERATQTEFVPQALNYDLTGQINFSKGCYTGQEVVARLHYRGKSKRRAFLYRLPAGNAGIHEPAIGMPVFKADGKPVGQVLNSAACEGEVRLLAAASIEDARGQLYLETAEGAALEALAMPYPVDGD